MQPEKAIIDACRKYGSHPIAYSTLQDNMEYFQFKDGYIPFRTAKFAPLFPKAAFTLGDPVCDDKDIGDTIDAFIAVHPNVCFCQIFKLQTAAALAERGFYINEFGIETLLDIKEDETAGISRYEFEGNSRQTLRTTRNHAKRAGVYVKEARISDVDAAAMKNISKEWISSKMSYEAEITFLARPLPEHDEKDVRQFYGFSPEGELLGFVFFDPIYRNSEVIGYSADILRDRKEPYTYKYIEMPEISKKELKMKLKSGEKIPEAKKVIRELPGILDFIVMEAFEKFKSEGKEVLAMGFSPFYKVKENEMAADGGGKFSSSSFTTWFCQFNYERMNHVYNYKGLSFHKERYKGREEKVYFCSKNKMSLFQILTLYGACDIHPIKKMLTNPAASAVSNAHMAKELLEKKLFLFD